MPLAQPAFDAVALLSAVKQQEVGLSVSTNNPRRFRAILYAAMRAAPHLRCFIYANPLTDRGFYILPHKLDSQEPLPEILAEEAA